MTAPAQAPVAFNFGFAFRNFAAQIAGKRQQREENARHVLSWGVDFCDRALGGIFRNDLALVAAPTNVGKTEFVAAVASVNARRRPHGMGKRVHAFFLEADEGEIEERIKWRMLTDAIYDDIRSGRLSAGAAERLSFLDWKGGILADLTDRYEDAADRILGDEYENLFTCYKARDFTADDFARAVKSVQHDTDLIILDHLHYVDTSDPNENRGYKAIVKTIRDVQRDINRPVVLVVHVRKPEGRIVRAMPRIEDIHGTSDIPKIATKIIMIARSQSTTAQPWLKPTLIAPLKCRVEGARTWHVGMCNFNVRRNAYEEAFTLGKLRLEKGEEKFEASTDWPHWARPEYRSVAQIARERSPDANGHARDERSRAAARATAAILGEREPGEEG